MSLTDRRKKQAGIPPVPFDLPPAHRSFFAALRENLAVRMGQEGDPFERAVTRRELLDGSWNVGTGGGGSGLGGGGYVSPGGPTPELDYSVPPAPTGLQTSGGFNFIYLVWDNTAGYYPSYAEVYRSTVDALDLTSPEMKLMGTAARSQYVDYLQGERTVYYYWVRFVKVVGPTLVYGPFSSTAGVPGQLSLDPSYVVDLLEGQLSESALAAELLTPIQAVPGMLLDLESQDTRLTLVADGTAANTAAVQTKAEAQVVTDLAGEVTGIKARYSIKLDVNGRMSGLIFGDNGTASSLVVASNSMLFIDPGQSITPFNPATDYTSMDALRDTQLVFGYAKVEGQNRFVINAPAYIPEGYITSGQVGAIGFGKIVDSNGEPVTTVAGKLLAQNIDVDNLSVASAATFYGNAQSGNYSAGLSGWRLLQTGDSEFNNATVRGRIEANTGYIAQTVQIGGTSQDIGDVLAMAESAAAGNSLAESWRKPNTTFIKGAAIFANDVYVDTVNIKGNAISANVTKTRSTTLMPYYSHNWNTYDSFSYEHGDPFNSIPGVVFYEATWTAYRPTAARLLFNGVVLFTTSYSIAGVGGWILVSLPPGLGTMTIQMRSNDSAGDLYIRSSRMLVMGAAR